jgi:hypothetical protein
MTEQTSGQNRNTARFIRNVLIKALLLFLALNFVVGLIPPSGTLGQISLYNRLFPGRARLPFGENTEQAFNLSLYDLEAMFASHEINARPKPEDEFRIILIGDSATWGTLLKPEETLSSLINQDQLSACGGKPVRAYNLAYPSMSLTKDLMILEKALTYDPDLILWPVTLESFPIKIQVDTPLVANNAARVQPLIEAYDLPLSTELEHFVEPNFWERTLIGRRRAILDAFQLQLYGVLWAATGIDQTYPENIIPAQRNFEADDDAYMGVEPPLLPPTFLAASVLHAGAEMAGAVPILVINEPILVSEGKNSDIRYNFFYPHWAYDQYRLMLAERSEFAKWHYADLWDFVPQEQFTNSAVHLTPEGMQIYYRALKPTIERLICP